MRRRRSVARDQGRPPRVVAIIRDRAVPDFLNRLVDHEEWNQKPFARRDRIAEAILDPDIEPGFLEESRISRPPRGRFANEQW